MGDLTKSALLEFMDDFEDDTESRKKDVNPKRHKECNWAIYDENGELICKVPTQNEAILTRAEFRKIDKEEYGKKKKYTIKKLD